MHTTVSLLLQDHHKITTVTGWLVVQVQYRIITTTGSLQLQDDYNIVTTTGTTLPQNDHRITSTFTRNLQRTCKEPWQEPWEHLQRTTLLIATQRAIRRQNETPKPGSPNAVTWGTTFGNALSVAKSCSLESCAGRTQKWVLLFSGMGSHWVTSKGGSGWSPQDVSSLTTLIEDKGAQPNLVSTLSLLFYEWQNSFTDKYKVNMIEMYSENEHSKGVSEQARWKTKQRDWSRGSWLGRNWEGHTNFETRRVQANVAVYASQHNSTCHSESEREGAECQPPFFEQHWITLEPQILVIKFI